jgi:PEP-CTERM motif
MKLTSCLLLLALSVSAHAGEITYSAPFLNRQPLPSFPGFDPSLGELHSVNLAVSGAESGYWSTTDGSLISSGVFNFRLEILVDGRFVGGGTTSTPFVFDPPSQNFPWGGSFALSSTLEDDLDIFLTPTVAPYFFVSAWFTPVALRGSLSTLAGVESITYTFGPSVPEPASVVMLVLGVAGLGLAGLRRHRAARARRKADADE